MKKNILLLLLASFMLAGCQGEYSYNPKHGGKYVPWDEEEDEPEDLDYALHCSWSCSSGARDCADYGHEWHDQLLIIL